MIAGRLDTRLTLLRRVKTPNGLGGWRTEWKEEGAIRAERVRITGTASRAAEDAFAGYSAVFNVRWAHQVSDNGEWRVREADTGRVFDVRNVIYNRAKMFKTLQCSRVNE